MSQNRRNTNPIGFLADQRQLSKNRKAAYGENFPQVVPLGFIPPFQIVRQPTASNINTIRLTKLSDGTTQTITVDMFATGFQTVDFTTYKLWIYPGTIPIPTSGIEEGIWTMELEDGSGGILYREDWCWMQESSMTGFVKMTWFHQREFHLPFGHIEFTAPFKYWHWFRTELGKPTYPLDRDVDERLSVEYVNTITSWKEQRFVTAGDENFVDALSFVRQMDCVDVEFLGDTINAFRVLVTPDWEGRGDLALIEVEIRSDQITTVFGDALETKDYIFEGDCVTCDFRAVTEVVEGSGGYNSGYYVNSENQTIYFEEGDLVIVKGVDIDLFKYSAGGYTIEPITSGQVVCNEDKKGFYFYDGSHLSKPTVLYSSGVVSGMSFNDGVVEIWGKTTEGLESKLLTVKLSDFTAGVALELGENIAIQARASTANCQQFEKSNWLAISDGIGIMEITTGSPVFRVI